MSNTELMSPKAIMKFADGGQVPLAWSSHLFGVDCVVGDGHARMSEKKLSRIWRGSIGRNSRSAAAAAMLSMLPKSALVVTRMYFRVFATV